MVNTPILCLKKCMNKPALIRHLVDLTFINEHEVKFNPLLLEEIKNADRLYIIAAGNVNACRISG